MNKNQPSGNSASGYEKLNIQQVVKVKRNTLPLHCPIDESSTWCSHPRVSLAIETAGDEGVRCPYCGTVYQLQD